MLRSVPGLLRWAGGGLGRHRQRHRDRDPEQGSSSARPEPSLLRFLVCPLSRRPLRYEEATNELINEELGIAYPIIDGIPNMVPEAARMMHKKPRAEGSEQP